MRWVRTLSLLQKHRHLLLAEFNEDSVYQFFNEKNRYACYHEYFKNSEPIWLCEGLVKRLQNHCVEAKKAEKRGRKKKRPRRVVGVSYEVAVQLERR